jgi:hypothetical protein
LVRSYHRTDFLLLALQPGAASTAVLPAFVHAAQSDAVVRYVSGFLSLTIALNSCSHLLNRAQASTAMPPVFVHAAQPGAIRHCGMFRVSVALTALLDWTQGSTAMPPVFFLLPDRVPSLCTFLGWFSCTIALTSCSQLFNRSQASTAALPVFVHTAQSDAVIRYVSGFLSLTIALNSCFRLLNRAQASTAMLPVLFGSGPEKQATGSNENQTV